MPFPTSPQSLVPGLAPHHLPALAQVLVQAAILVTSWDQRRRSRRALAEMPIHLLEDIGLSRQQRQAEIQKMFWQK